MLKVWKYSLGYTFRRKATVAFAVLIFIITLFVLTLLYHGLKSTNNGKIIFQHSKIEMLLGSSSIFVLLPSFVLLSSYIAIIVGQIFKRSASDGTTLLLVSSQFTRSQVIMGRFLCVLTHLLIVSTIFGSATFLSALFIQPEKMGWEFVSLLSTIFGIFFLGLILAGISLLLVLFLGRIGALVSSIFIMVTLPIFSLILVSMTSNNKEADALNTSWTNDPYILAREYYIDDSNTDLTTGDVIDYAVQPVVENYSMTDSSYFDSLLNAKYNGLAWIDFWSQWSRMIEAFLPATTNVTENDKIKAIDLTGTNFFKALVNTDGYTNAKGQEAQKNASSKPVFKLHRFLKDILTVPSSYSNAKYIFNYTAAQRIDALDKAFNLITRNITSSEFKNKINSVYEIFSYTENNDKVDISSVNWKPGQGDLNGIKIIVDNSKNVLFSGVDYSPLVNSIFEIKQSIDDKFKPTSFNENTLELEGTTTTPNGHTKYELGSRQFILRNNLSDIQTFQDANEIYKILSSNDEKKILQWFAIYLGTFEKQKDLIATARYDYYQQNQGIPASSVNNMPSVVTKSWNGTIVKNIYEHETSGTYYAKQSWNSLPSSNNSVNLTRAVGSDFTYSSIVPTPFICIFWPVVAIGLFGAVYLLHKRADFS